MSRKINFFSEGLSFVTKQKQLIREWISKSIKTEGYITGNINIILCTDDYLHKMNIKYLDHDTLTDIITFDYSEGKTVSGDIFLSFDRIQENAGIFSKNPTEEFHRVIIHGILHLCNYDDKKKNEKEIMTQKENNYLSQRADKLKVS